MKEHRKIPRQFGSLSTKYGLRYVSIYCDSVAHKGTVMGVRTYQVWPDGSFTAAHYYVNPDGSTGFAQSVDPPVILPEDDRTAGWGTRSVEQPLQCPKCRRPGRVEVRSERLGPILDAVLAEGASQVSLSELAARLDSTRER